MWTESLSSRAIELCWIIPVQQRKNHLLTSCKRSNRTNIARSSPMFVWNCWITIGRRYSVCLNDDVPTRSWREIPERRKETSTAHLHRAGRLTYRTFCSIFEWCLHRVFSTSIGFEGDVRQSSAAKERRFADQQVHSRFSDRCTIRTVRRREHREQLDRDCLFLSARRIDCRRNIWSVRNHRWFSIEVRRRENFVDLLVGRFCVLLNWTEPRCDQWLTSRHSIELSPRRENRSAIDRSIEREEFTFSIGGGMWNIRIEPEWTLNMCSWVLVPRSHRRMEWSTLPLSRCWMSYREYSLWGWIRQVIAWLWPCRVWTSKSTWLICANRERESFTEVFFALVVLHE